MLPLLTALNAKFLQLTIVNSAYGSNNNSIKKRNQQKGRQQPNVKRLAKKNVARSYNSVKRYGAEQYTGMQVGRSGKWNYDAGVWREPKATPERWELTYDVIKRRAGDALNGSRVLGGTAYHGLYFRTSTLKSLMLMITPHQWLGLNLNLPINVQTMKNGIHQITLNGIGFDQNEVSKIFTMFERLHTRQKFAGSGIGLTISEKIAKAHGGYIGVISEEGKGSTFTCCFCHVN